MPLLESGQSSPNSLPMLVSFLFPILDGLTVAVFLQLFLLMIFTHSSLRALDLSHRASVFGGLAFSLSTFTFSWPYFPHLRVLPYPPLMLFALEKLPGAPRRRDVLLLAFATAQMVVAGHPESAFFHIGFGGFYFPRLWWMHPGPARAVLSSDRRGRCHGSDQRIPGSGRVPAPSPHEIFRPQTPPPSLYASHRRPGGRRPGPHPGPRTAASGLRRPLPAPAAPLSPHIADPAGSPPLRALALLRGL
jgi:hypothetical protein